MAGMATDFSSWFARLRARGLSLWQAAWLVLCLLIAQHAGLVHRVEHGGLAGTPWVNLLAEPAHAAGATADAAAPLAQKTSGHSCVLFDGATAADLHCGSVVVPVLAYGKPVNPASLTRSWPDLPSRHPFRSRAPPALALQV
jgi:hypothetical protein